MKLANIWKELLSLVFLQPAGRFFYVFWVSVMFFSIFWWGVRYQIAEKGETVGWIESKEGRRGVRYHYKVGGEEFNRYQRIGMIRIAYTEPGAFFIVRYSLTDPSLSRMQFHRPVISNDSTFEETSTVSLEVKGDLVLFKFVVDGKRYTGAQVVECDINEGASVKYPVRYLIADPSFAYLCVDSVNCWSYRPAVP